MSFQDQMASAKKREAEIYAAQEDLKAKRERALADYQSGAISAAQATEIDDHIRETRSALRAELQAMKMGQYAF